MDQKIQFYTASDGVRIAYSLVGDGPPLVKAPNWLTHLECEWDSPVWSHCFVESLAGGDSLYPPSALLLFLLDPYRSLGWKLVLHVFFAGIFMYGWIRRLGLSKPSALLAGLAYGLAPFMVSLVLVGGDGKIFVTALAPLLFWWLSSRAPRIQN